jgi:integrative and conjugative element protein (TIGR02256 family)
VDYTYKINNAVLIINDNVFQKLLLNRQHNKSRPESGGIIIGRTDIYGITRIYEITEPMSNDIQDRITFKRRDKGHLTYLIEANKRCLYFKGNWHTHAQDIPAPSWLDKMSWMKAIKNSKPGDSEFIFFIIVGTKEVKVWCGNMKTLIIDEMLYQITWGDEK